MPANMLSPKDSVRASELAERPYRPRPIVELRERIEAETRAAELKASITGEIDQTKIQQIVAMKIELDDLYGAWVLGQLD